MRRTRQNLLPPEFFPGVRSWSAVLLTSALVSIHCPLRNSIQIIFLKMVVQKNSKGDIKLNCASLKFSYQITFKITMLKLPMAQELSKQKWDLQLVQGEVS